MILDAPHFNCQTATMKDSDLYSNPVSVNEAVEQLNNASVVALPTETVYGLAGLANSDDAVFKIFETKGRPRFNPLIVHCANLQIARSIAQFDALAEQVADAFWPGPLTLVLLKTANAELSDLVTAGLDSVAIRLPKHPIAREILSQLSSPVAAPSANPSGKLSPTTALHVIDGFDGRVPVVDGGHCDAGIESTILAIIDGQITMLRPGTITKKMVENAVGQPVGDPQDEKIVAPGMLKSHYAPNASVRLAATSLKSGEALLAFGPVAESLQTDGAVTLNLSVAGDLAEAAKNLFQFLRQLDAQNPTAIAVMPIPNEGIGIAINDRLERAAADRTS